MASSTFFAPSPLCERCSAVSPTFASPWRAPRRKALLIGINSREDTLHGPHRDVADMKRLLVASYGFRHEDVRVLVDDNDPVHPQPDRETIMTFIQDFVDGTRPGDRLFFLYCGHTIQVPTLSPTEEDGLDECIVPLDGEEQMIKDNELRAHLVDPLPAGSSLVAVFDSCHSASLLDLDHIRCNRVFVPWVSKANRNTDELRSRMVRQLALPLLSPCSPVRKPARSSPTRIHARRMSIDAMLSPLRASPRYTYTPKSPLVLSPAPGRFDFLPLPKISDDAPAPSNQPMPPPVSLPAAAAVPRRASIRKRPRISLSTAATALDPIRNQNAYATRRAHLPSPLKLWQRNKENLLVAPGPRTAVDDSRPRSSYSPSSPSTAWYTSPMATATILSPSATLCDSPAQTFCQGWCRSAHAAPAASGKPSPLLPMVISLSACKDSELAWETADGASMTQALINVLLQDAHPTLRELVTRVSHTLHASARERHSRIDIWRNYRKTHAMLSPIVGSYDAETFQHPQIASHKPLDMDTRWEL